MAEKEVVASDQTVEEKPGQRAPFYAHVYKPRAPEEEGQLRICVSTEDPDEFENRITSLGDTYYGNVPIKEIERGNQLAHATAELGNTDLISMKTAIPRYPHVRDLTKRLKREGVSTFDRFLGFYVDNQPDKVLKVLQDFSANPGNFPKPNIPSISDVAR